LAAPRFFLFFFFRKKITKKKRAGRAFAKKYGAEKSRENQAAPSHVPRVLVVFFAQKPLADFSAPYF
jgi:hypothetical protein